MVKNETILEAAIYKPPLGITTTNLLLKGLFANNLLRGIMPPDADRMPVGGHIYHS